MGEKRPDLKWLSERVTESQGKKLSGYIQELLRFNKKFNLLSRRQGERFCWEMVLDSLLASQLLLKQGSFSVITDIGSGAGFPGIVLAILKPAQRVDLLEPHTKRARFLEYVCWKMGLKKVKIYNIPVQEHNQTICCGVSKAFLSLSQRLILTGSLFKSKKVYFHLQSVNWRDEWLKLPLNIQKSWSVSDQEYGLMPYLPQRVLLKTTKVI